MSVCRRVFAYFAFTAILLPLALASQPGTASPARFPDTTSYSLAKAKLNFPSGFAGQINLLLVSFQPEQRKEIDSWMPVAQALQHTNFNFHWYRLPVSSNELWVFRWWDNASMRSDETDPETWPWIVPLYVDKDSFRHSLQIPSEKQISVLLVDRQGNVLWRAEGPMTPEKRNSLLAAAGTH
ncbi:MAG TPA: hypothetical protein VGT04_02730 [Acidobacteriaceae bacterium]|nr:hypothetical protein [Acidobacteriaceae bacterium]